MDFPNVPGRIRTADLLVGEPRGSSVQSGNDPLNLAQRRENRPNLARTATRSGKRTANGESIDFCAAHRQRMGFQRLLADCFGRGGDAA